MLSKLNAKKDQRGFTLIELMIVIAIIGILAAIAIPQFNSYRKRAYNASAMTDMKNAFTASQAYFSDEPSGTSSLLKLQGYGYTSSEGVTLGGFNDSTSQALTSYHGSGDKTYTISATGAVSK